MKWMFTINKKLKNDPSSINDVPYHAPLNKEWHISLAIYNNHTGKLATNITISKAETALKLPDIQQSEKNVRKLSSTGKQPTTQRLQMKQTKTLLIELI